MSRTLRAALTTLLCLATFGAGASAAHARTLDMLIAGDSYASGVGLGTYDSSGCLRSRGTWGELYANRLRAEGTTVNVKNVACGGAVVQNLDAQIKSITPETDLVVLTIGGNDVGFVNIVLQCFAPGINDPARCRDAVISGMKKVPSVQAAALQRVRAVRARGRQGIRIVVVSYPYLANPSNYILRGLFNSYNAGLAARQLGDMGDQAIINAATTANAEAGYEIVTLAPTKDLFVGHEPNQDPIVENPARWVNEFTGVKTPVDYYHPNFNGYKAMAEAVWRISGPAHDFGVAQD
jgi:lysophospholipase L1-like esterase